MKSTHIAWKHIRRSPYQAIAAVLTMFLTFLLAGMFVLSIATSVIVLQFFESKPQITVFFSDKAGENEVKVLQKSLDETGKIAGTKYVSKEEALAIYREQNKNDPLLLEMVTADILPASLEVSAVDPKYLSDLEPIMKGASGVEEVVYQKDVVNMLLTWTNAIRIIGGIMVGLFTINALLITMTVISMKIALKREELEILKLIGASPWYIRMPFIWEGGIYGIVGAFTAGIVIIGFILWFQPYLLSFLGTIPVIQILLSQPSSQIFILAGSGFVALLAIFGFLLGSLGSLVALGRYLKY